MRHCKLRKRGRTKEKTLRQHARRRASERYGLSLTDKLHAQIVKQIQTSKSKLIEKQSNRISIHDVTIGEDLVRVVYDRERKLIVTFLYKDESLRFPTMVVR